jgi:hypothetical protein
MRIRFRDPGFCHLWIRDQGSCQPWIRDPESGIEKSDSGSWIRDQHPGSAILCATNCYLHLADNSATGSLILFARNYTGLVAIASFFIYFFSFSTYIPNHIHTVQYIHLSSFAEASLHC